MFRKLDRLRRERHTIRVMIELFCRDSHHSTGALCGECRELYAYAIERIEKCPYEDDKPTCAKCPVHCYKPLRRDQVRQVMRYAGPRMLRSHPLLTLLHYLDGAAEPSARTLEAALKSRRRRADSP